jgi:hypothetical protein
MMEFLAFWFLCAIVSAIIASSKGRSTFGWFLLGCLISFFAIILVAVLPSKKVDTAGPSPDTHVRCPDCRELVYKDARKCKHCSTTLIPQG